MTFFGPDLRNGLPIGLGSVAGFGTARQFSPLSLFTGGVQGTWYDPSDLTTLFQDSAGTTPVSGVEQVVGRMLDKSGNGNHATATGSARPTLSARVNLLTRTEDFSNAVWTKSGTSVNTAAGIAPDGTNTANKIYPTSTGSFRQVFVTLTTVAISYTATIYAKAAEKNIIAFVDFAGGAGAAWFNLSTGVASNVVGGYTASITSVGNGWYRCSLTGTAPAGLGYYSIFIADSAGGAAVTASGTDGVLLWGADLRPTNIGSSIPVYQRVVTATNYDSTGFPLYLSFAGAQAMSTPANVNLSGTDKATVFAGVRKLADGFYPTIAEMSTDASANNGTLAIYAAGSNTPRYPAYLRGTTRAGFEPQTYAAPISNVFTVAADISQSSASTELVPRLNGVVNQTNPGGAADAGTGNFGSYPLFIGARNNGAGFLFTGNIYSLLVVGSAVSAANITSTETWVNGKTGGVY